MTPRATLRVGWSFRLTPPFYIARLRPGFVVHLWRLSVAKEQQ